MFLLTVLPILLLAGLIFDFGSSDSGGGGENTEIDPPEQETPETEPEEETPTRVGARDFLGTSDDENIWGTNNDDFIHLGGGADTVSGMLGDDELIGGAGADVIYGGEGDDEIEGGLGQDTIFGGDGNDTIGDDGSEGADFIRGGTGADTITDSLGKNTIYGDSGDDVIDVVDAADNGITADTVIAGTGDDRISIDEQDEVTTGEGADVVLIEGPAAVADLPIITDFDVAQDQLVMSGSTGGELTFEATEDGSTIVRVGEDAFAVLEGIAPTALADAPDAAFTVVNT